MENSPILTLRGGTIINKEDTTPPIHPDGASSALPLSPSKKSNLSNGSPDCVTFEGDLKQAPTLSTSVADVLLAVCCLSIAGPKSEEDKNANIIQKAYWEDDDYLQVSQDGDKFWIQRYSMKGNIPWTL